MAYSMQEISPNCTKCTTLLDLKTGQQAHIESIQGADLQGMLYELGFIPTVSIRVCWQIKWLGVVCVSFCGTTLALRRQEARNVRICP